MHRPIVVIPMDPRCASFVVDLLLFCYKGDFTVSLSDNNQAGVIEKSIFTSRKLDD